MFARLSFAKASEVAQSTRRYGRWQTKWKQATLPASSHFNYLLPFPRPNLVGAITFYSVSHCINQIILLIHHCSTT